MLEPIEDQPLIALADDDTESARTMLRTLGELGLRRVKWHGDAERSLRLFAETFHEDRTRWPSLIVVDLKSSSTANADFIRALSAIAPVPQLVVAMAPSLERDARTALIEAGAAAVFERHIDPGAYQREVASLVGFLDRHLVELGAIEDEDDGQSHPEFTIETGANAPDPEQGAQ